MSKTTKVEEYVYDNAVVTYDVTTEVTWKQKSAKNTLPKVPYALWQQAVSFMSHIANNQNTEAIISLTIVDNEWRIICWHQEPSGQLHVDFKEGSKENQDLLTDEEREALLKVHCTIHSHNKSGAFQSGDDKDDELGKEGWHITVGNCDKETISTHCRLNCKQIAQFDAKGKKTADGWQDFIECSPLEVIAMPKIPKKYKQFMKDDRVLINRNHKVDYPEEWNERAKKKAWFNPNQTNMGQNRGRNTNKTTNISYLPAKRNNHHHTQTQSIIDTSFPFEMPMQLKRAEWILTQELWNLYKNKDMIEDVVKHSYVHDDLTIQVDAAIENTETYFIVEQGKDPDMVSCAIPDTSDVIDFLHDVLPDVRSKTPINTPPRMKDKALMQALFTNLKTQAIFGNMS